MKRGSTKASKPPVARGDSRTVRDLCTAMERIAPTYAAAEWDNVGLLAGDAAWPVTRLLLTIDLTPAVLDEAVKGRAEAIVSYHPLLYKPTKRMVVGRTSTEGLAAEALARHIAVYSPHTALDAAPGGANDALAELCGLLDTRPFTATPQPASNCKLVVFVPDRHVEEVAEAVFSAGGGVIGDYTQCSYRVSGHGTFYGGESTDPAVGRKGRLERVEELRLEVIFPAQRMAEVVAAVRRSHPYEEPAFDLYPLQSPSVAGLGQGRIGRFAKSMRLEQLVRLLTERTGASQVSLVGHPRTHVTHGLVCVGAAGSLPFEIPGRPCDAGDVVITGEIRHHDALRYARSGAAAIALGHWASERPALSPLAARLKALLPGVVTVVSRADRDPFGAGA